MSTEIFPWQTSIWHFLLERFQQNRLPQAFLFEGMKGIGKSLFARAFSEFLLCQANALEKSCEQCDSCQLLKAETHPDLIKVSPEGASHSIKIDQIRSLNEAVFKTKHFQGYRVVIIESAHAMNLAASNALLKTLEEPAQKVIFILLTNNLHRISPTIRSRCEKISFPKPELNEAKTWLTTQIDSKILQNYSIELLLRITQGSPLEAKQLVENNALLWREKLITDFSEVILGKANALGFSEQYKTLEMHNLFFWIKTIVIDLIRMKAGEKESIIHSDLYALLSKIVGQLNTLKLFNYLDKLYELEKSIQKGFNLNAGLVVDQIFLGLL